MKRAQRTTAGRSAWLGAALAAVIVVAGGDARAHFRLLEPACFSEQDSVGVPLKSPPCGQDDPAAPVVLTGAVTHYAAGDVITVTIDERITHPGHYRIAIAPDMASLPADPPVTAGASPCGATVIDPTPTLPLLADGVLVHTARFDGPQTVEIPLPAGFECDECVLQVVEFMSNHGLNNPGGCFYHHCAVVSVGDGAPGEDVGGSGADAAGAGDDAGADVVDTTDAVVTTDTATGARASDAGGCDAGGEGAGALLLFAAALLLALARRLAPTA